MFFDLQLLTRQHGGRFQLAWIAALRGIKHVKKNDVITLDLVKLCEEITGYVVSDSESVRSRFSLRFSATLLNGTIKLYSQQAHYVIEDFFKFLNSLSPATSITPRSTKRKAIGSFDTPPSPVVRQRVKKAKKVEQDTPDSQIQRLVQAVLSDQEVPIVAEEQAIVQARADEITLREIQPQPVEDRGGDFGDLGVLQEEDLEGFDLPPVPLPVRQKVTPLPRLPSTSDESPEIPSTTFTVVAMVHAPAEPLGEEPEAPIPKRARTEELDQIQQVSVPPREEPEIMEIEEAPPRPVLAELPISLVEARDRRVAKTPKPPVVKGIVSTKKPTRVVRIDRCKLELGNMQLGEIEKLHLPEFKLRTPHLTNLLNKYLVRDHRESHVLEKRSGSLRDSAARPQKKSGEMTPVELTQEDIAAREVVPPVQEERQPVQQPEERELVQQVPEIIETLVPPEVEAPLMASTPLPMERQAEVEYAELQGTIEETLLAPAANAGIRKKRRLLDEAPESLKVQSAEAQKMPSFLGPSTELLLPQESTTEGVSVPLAVDTEKDRQQKLLNEIFQSGQERYTLEEISYKPVNRLNIARTFNDLLVLCKHGYVNLISEENSSELAFIEKGPRLKR